MNAVLAFVGGNALSAAILFAVALTVERFVPRPSVRHAAWLAVLLRLLIPPILAVRSAEEAACDALVVRAHPHLRRAYADGLIETLEFVSHSPAPTALATGAADSRDLKERLVNILQPSGAPPLPRRLRRLVAVVALLAVSLTPGWSRVTAAVDETAPPEAARRSATNGRSWITPWTSSSSSN